jgi:hypothetical protein
MKLELWKIKMAVEFVGSLLSATEGLLLQHIAHPPITAPSSIISSANQLGAGTEEKAIRLLFRSFILRSKYRIPMLWNCPRQTFTMTAKVHYR